MHQFKLAPFILFLGFSSHCSNGSLFSLLHCSFPLIVIDDYDWKASTLYSSDLGHNVGGYCASIFVLQNFGTY